MKSRKPKAAALASEPAKPVIPKTIIAEITACAIRLTSTRAQAHRKCGRRECRIGQCCSAEGLGDDGAPACASHWEDNDHGFFLGACMFGVLNLCPRIPEGADLEDYRWKEEVEDNPFDLVPQVTFVHRSQAEEL